MANSKISKLVYILMLIIDICNCNKEHQLLNPPMKTETSWLIYKLVVWLALWQRYTSDTRIIASLHIPTLDHVLSVAMCKVSSTDGLHQTDTDYRY